VLQATLAFIPCLTDLGAFKMLTVLIVHILFAILLFYAVNWIGEHSSTYGYLQLSLFARGDQAPAFNFVLKTLTPAVFIILMSTLFYKLRLEVFITSIWHVAAYYFAFRTLYNVALGRWLLLNWVSTIAQGLAGVLASYIAYIYLVIPRTPLFPDLAEIGNQLWIIVGLFLYATFNNVRLTNEGSIHRKNRYLRSRLKYLRKSYGRYVEGQFSERYMELVAYAILLHETFNRPRVAQLIERVVFPWGSRTLGPMQIATAKRISDVESVRLGVQKLRSSFEATQQELAENNYRKYQILSLTLAKYNRDETYINEVTELIHILWAQIAPEYREDFEKMHHGIA
jgi:hypothetical protein